MAWLLISLVVVTMLARTNALACDRYIHGPPWDGDCAPDVSLKTYEHVCRSIKTFDLDFWVKPGQDFQRMWVVAVIRVSPKVSPDRIDRWYNYSQLSFSHPGKWYSLSTKVEKSEPGNVIVKVTVDNKTKDLWDTDVAGTLERLAFYAYESDWIFPRRVPCGIAQQSSPPEKKVHHEKVEVQLGRTESCCSRPQLFWVAAVLCYALVNVLA